MASNATRTIPSWAVTAVLAALGWFLVSAGQLAVAYYVLESRVVHMETIFTERLKHVEVMVIDERLRIRRNNKDIERIERDADITRARTIKMETILPEIRASISEIKHILERQEQRITQGSNQ